MNRFFPLAALAVAPLADARFNRLAERHNAAECCPCAGSGAPNQPVTVTVTQQASAPPAPQTVTVERIVPAPAAPVYVTQNNNNNNNNINNNNNGSQGQPQATVINNNGPQGVSPQPAPPQGAPPQEGPQTQTVTVDGGRPAPAPDAGSPSGTVTVTATPQATEPATPSQPPAESPSRPEGTPDVTKTVIVPQPSVQSASPPPVTVTAPPMQPQGTGTGTGPYQTVTQTVGGGGDNIEIIIIYTGESSCRKKHSGKPCRKGHGKPSASSRPCPSVVNSTRIATVYNTVSVVIAGPSMPYQNSTSSDMGAAQATGMMKRFEDRKPRAPLAEEFLDAAQSSAHGRLMPSAPGDS